MKKLIIATSLAVLLAGCGKDPIDACVEEIEGIATNAKGVNVAAPKCKALSVQETEDALKRVRERNPNLKVTITKDAPTVPLSPLLPPVEQKNTQETAESKSANASKGDVAKTQKPTLDKVAATARAKNALKLIESALKDLNAAVETQDSGGFVRYVSRPLHEEIMGWNGYEYPFEFEACRGALLEAHSYAMTIYKEYLSGTNSNGISNRKDREWAEKHLKEFKAQCRLAIRS